MAQQTAVAPAGCSCPGAGDLRLAPSRPLILRRCIGSLSAGAHGGVDNDGQLVLALATAPRWLEDGTLEIQLRQGEKRLDPLRVKRFSRQSCSRRWMDSRGGRVLGEAVHGAKCQPPSEWR
jgi:hypothetical protein